MSWSDVGGWIKNNAGTGASLVGSLLTGNYVGAISQGIALVSGATGTDDPYKAMEELKNNPETLLKLKELAYKEEESIREHIRKMNELELEDKQAEHSETQKTVRAGDIAADRFVRWTRPGQSWVSLGSALVYVFKVETVDVTVLGLLLTLPWAYAGLRQIGKGVDVVSSAMTARSKPS